jgi:hypothetical protein
MEIYSIPGSGEVEGMISTLQPEVLNSPKLVTMQVVCQTSLEDNAPLVISNGYNRCGTAFGLYYAVTMVFEVY